MSILGRSLEALLRYGYNASDKPKSVTSSYGTTTLSYDYESRVTSIFPLTLMS